MNTRIAAMRRSSMRRARRFRLYAESAEPGRSRRRHPARRATLASTMSSARSQRPVPSDVTMSDAAFDQVLPAWAQLVSKVHWTPLAVARRAAELLVRDPESRILDVGSGVGKF